MLGLAYMKPLPLLNTAGSDWEYQPDISLKQTLKMEIKEHYKQVVLGKFDKTNIPIYLFLSGAGTGKSRNASEFHKTAINCLSANEDEELLARIKDAYVFHVSYENGTNLRPKEDDPLRAVGSRMLFQLLREEMSLNDVLFRYEAPFPMSVVSLVAKHENRDMKDITVILVVDGMQELMVHENDGLDKNSAFYRTLSSIGDLGLEKIFLMPCCTCTITSSIESVVALSHRKRVYLPVASLKPPEYRQGKNLVPVFEKKDIMNILVEDCGGHGRALEVLSECMAGRSIDNCNFDNLMHDLRVRLTDRYKEAIWKSRSDAKAIARAILTRSLLDIDKPVPKTEKKPDQFVQGGLIRFERKNEAPRGYFTAPYIWLWIFVEISNEWKDPILRDWAFADYRELLSLSRSKPWQSFENFVASFRCLKSAVIEENEPTTISEVHAGARLNGDVQFINHNLHLQFAKHQTDTNSENNPASEWNVECNNTIVDVQKFKHCIINAPSSPYGDAFLSLDQPDAKSLNEIHQYKHTQKSISQELYQTERKKSSSENDFFILFTTSEDCDIELPKRSGIVDGKVFSDYFGPFAGRAYRSVEPFFVEPVPKVNINTASFNQLCKVYLIGERRANSIISKRPFNSIIEANLKTKIPKKILQNLSFQKGHAFHTISRILPRFI